MCNFKSCAFVQGHFALALYLTLLSQKELKHSSTSHGYKQNGRRCLEDMGEI